MYSEICLPDVIFLRCSVTVSGMCVCTVAVAYVVFPAFPESGIHAWLCVFYARVEKDRFSIIIEFYGGRFTIMAHRRKQ